MKIIPLHTINTAIVYKNSLCSMATMLVLLFITLSVMLPVILVSLLSPYSGIVESRVHYEQPQMEFKFQYIFIATLESHEPNQQPTLVACSSFVNFNTRMGKHTQHCEGTKYWIEDLDHDSYTDRAHFQLQLADLPARLLSLELVLFFDAQLQHKCKLTPPAVLTYQQIVPSYSGRLQTGRVALKAELQLRQYVEFTCPFPGRSTKTNFRQVQLDTNNSYADMTQYQMESLLAQIKANPAYFQLDVQQSFYDAQSPHMQRGLNIELELDVLQVAARYHLSIWERLGQFWLYFASFFGISFYIMNKLKDYLFGRHIVRSYETIPWKKLY